jgi:hypothetical protein
MNIGDKVKCDNGHTYTLANGDGFYTFALVDEFGDVVNLIHDYALEDCLPYRKEDQQSLCVGEDKFNKLKYTMITEYICII